MARQVLTLPDLPATLLTEAEAATTYLTQANAASTYLPLSHAPGTDPHTQYYNQSRGDARYLQTTTAAATYQPLGSYSLTSHNHSGVYSPVAHDHDPTYLKLTGGTLSGNLGVGVTPAAWGAAGRAVQVGQRGVVWNYDDATYHTTHLANNLYYDGSAYRAIATGPSMQLSLGQGSLQIGNAPSVAAGAVVALANRVELTPAGTLNLVPDAGQNALVASGNVGVAKTPEALNTTYRFLRVGATAALQSHGTLQGGTSLVDNALYTQGGVNVAMAAGTSTIIQMGGGLNVLTAPSVAAGANLTFTQRLALTMTGTLTAYPDPDVWGLAVTSGVTSFGVIRQANNNFQLTTSGTASIVFQSGTNIMHPGTDNSQQWGWTSARWAALYAVNGAIQTSTYEMKQDFAPLDPAACAQAVLETDWVNFRYLPPVYQEPPEREGEEPEDRQRQVSEGRAAHAKMLVETAPARHQKGYVLKSPEHRVHDLFGLEDRESASPSSDLAVVACGLQAALKRIATLETHILQLEAAR